MAIAGRIGAIYVSDINTPAAAFTGEACTGDTTGALAYKRYQIDDTTKRYWSPDDPIEVKVNGNVIKSGFFIEHVGGVLIFKEVLEPTDTVTVSGKSVKIVEAGGFFNWSVDAALDTEEASTFGSDGWKTFVGTLSGWAGSAEAYWTNKDFVKSVGRTMIVQLFTDAGPAKDRLEGLAVITGDSIETPVDGIVEETIDFQGTGPLYIRM